MSEGNRDLYVALRSAATDRTNAVRLLEELATEVESEDPKRLARIDDCFYAIAESAELTGMALTAWLTGNGRLTVAKRMIRYLNVSATGKDDLVPLSLGGASLEEAILVACRLCAQVASPKLVFAWTLAILRSFSAKTRAQVAALYVLGFLAEEYPNTTLELLRRVDTADVSKKCKALLNDLHQQLQQRQNELDGFPTLREFAMSQEQRSAYFASLRRQQQEIHKHAERTSVLSQLCMKRTFKYSSTVTIELPGVTGEELPVEMARHSVRAEMPLSEWRDPQAGYFRRRRMWEGLPV